MDIFKNHIGKLGRIKQKAKYLYWYICSCFKYPMYILKIWYSKRRDPERYYDLNSEFNRHYKNRKPIAVLGNANVSVADLVFAQYQTGDFSRYMFCDLIPRLEAIGEYYGQNDYGYEFYQKLQDHSGFDWLPRFKSLIESVDKNGLGNSAYIEVDNSFTIMDGAHRLALAIWHKQEFIPVKIYNFNNERQYSIDYFWKKSFSTSDLHIIETGLTIIKDSLRYDYFGCIWPSAMKYKDDIIADITEYSKNISNVDGDSIKLVDYYDVEFDSMDFEGFLRAMYHMDILNEKGMKYKVARIVNCLPANTTRFPVRIFRLHIQNPQMERNVKNNSMQSRVVRSLKLAIRERYAGKIENYVYDVAFHISDNYQQSKFCQLAIEAEKNISKIFQDFNTQYKYVVIKAEKRLAPSFPYYYNHYSEVDVLVAGVEVESAADWMCANLSAMYNNDDWWHISKEIRQDGTVMANVYLDSYRMLCMHFQTTEKFETKSSFNGVCIANRELSTNGAYYILPSNYDIIIRAYEYLKNPAKVWHYQFIKEHVNEFDMSLLKDAYEEQSKYYQSIKELIKKM